MVSPLESFMSANEFAQNTAARKQALSQQAQAFQGQQRQQELALDNQQTAQLVQRAQLMSNSLQAIKQASPDPAQRMQMALQAVPKLQQLGIQVTPEQIQQADFSDQGIDNYIAQTSGFAKDPQAGLQQLTAQQREFESLVNQGNLSEEERQRAARVKLRIEAPEVGSAVQTVARDLGITVEEAQKRLESSKVTGKRGSGRVQDIIDQGIESTTTINDIGRALELLNQVNTGKPEAVLLSAKQAFGLEAANEAELKSLLGRAVIANLRASFGGNPTEGERAALSEVEASFSQQGEVNKRLLNNTLNKLEAKIDKAIRAAERENDQFAEDELDLAKERIEAIKSAFETTEAPKSNTFTSSAGIRFTVE